MRIGVFVCHCGTNIAATVDISEVVEAAKKMPGVVYAEDNKYTCSDPGQASIRKAILEHKLDRVVVASCSPLMHEKTFRRTVSAVGLNPYLVEMANIREQCSWVHRDKESATKKAIDIVRMALAKVSRNEALFSQEIGITKRALVIGGGIAGMQAALDIANAGYEVVLVEREPTIGGRMAQLDKTFPTLDCSACILTPKMVDAARHPNITLLAYSEVESVEGFIGNFKVRIRRKARYVDEEKCTGCGECSRVEIPEGGLKEYEGELWVDRIVVDEGKCVQCGECVNACVRENKENQQALTSIAHERRKYLELPPQKREGRPLEALFQQIALMDFDARADFWRREFKKCIKCFGCKDVCPLCQCEECELEDPEWISLGRVPPDFPLFHLIRAYHLADSCINCGMCEETCPANIPLRTLMHLACLDKEKIFDYVPELDEELKEKLINSTKERPIHERKVKA